MQNICENLVMKEKFKTSIHITGPAIEAYQRLIRRYSAKLAVSAAIYAFEKIGADEQLKYIDLVSGEQIPAEASPGSRQQLRNAMIQLKEMVEIERQQPGTIYHVLNPEEQKVLDDFRKIMTLKEPQKQKRA
ncbi:MAG: hypothetical protein ABSB91_00340 [Sedimentisphaerales bacterium]|jgi:hypothetical protein